MQDKDMIKSLSRALAGTPLPTDKLELVAASVSRIRDKGLPMRLDLCKYGICIDFLVPGSIREVNPRDWIDFDVVDVAGIEVFPWGILNPDMVQVRVSQRM